ncbi:unnamed protein product, partial [Iphiclides podalirius]
MDYALIPSVQRRPLPSSLAKRSADESRKHRTYINATNPDQITSRPFRQRCSPENSQVQVMSPLKFLIFAALATAACAGGGRRRLPDPVPAPMPDPNFMEVSIVPCDASNNFCGSITTPPPIMEGTGGFYLPGK